MKISKGNVGNINRKILAGTIAFTFLTTRLIGYKVVKDIKYSHIKSGYDQIEMINVTTPKEYVIIPKKNELSFFGESDLFKENNEKNRVNKLTEKRKTRVLRKYHK